MKIGILTFHHALNVGAVLQAYCLQTYLVGCGHEVEFIDYQPNRKGLTLRSLIGRGFSQTLRKWQDHYRTYYYESRHRFNNVLNVGDTRYATSCELKVNPPRCDLYIAGSDQIWNFKFSRPFDGAYFLDFGDQTTKRVAFAASLGQNEIPEELNERFVENLKRFDQISVRESSSVELLSQLIRGDSAEVEHICDPTFLLRGEQFKQIEQAPSSTDAYVVSYMLPHYEMGQDLVDAVYFVEKTLSLKLINIRNPNTCHRFDRAVNRIATPQQWLGYFKNAKFAICCSFHAVVFSLIYHMPFIVISPYENNRILSLLEAVGLCDRCVYTYDHAKIRNILGSEINWSRVDGYFAKERERSVRFLQEAMSLS